MLSSLSSLRYGGNGRTTSALPDLRSKVSIDAGSGAGLMPRLTDDNFGAGQFYLTINNLTYTHTTITTTTVYASSRNDQAQSRYLVSFNPAS